MRYSGWEWVIESHHTFLRSPLQFSGLDLSPALTATGLKGSEEVVFVSLFHFEFMDIFTDYILFILVISEIMLYVISEISSDFFFAISVTN